MKFGVRECANIVFRAKQPIRIGTATFQAGQPVLYIDTATTSSIEQATTTVYAQGGRGNARLRAWEGQKTLTFSFTDALLSPVGFAILSGAGLFKRGNGIDSDKETALNEDLVHFHMTSGATLDVAYTAATTAAPASNTVKIDLRDAIAEFGNLASVSVDDAPIFILETEDDGSLTGNIYSGTVTTASTVSTGVIELSNVKDASGAIVDEDKAVMVDYYIDLPGKHVYEADITPDTFGGNYYVEADTLFRDQYTGKDLPANLTFPNVRLQSNFTMTFAGTGDPSTFDFTMDAFPGYTYFDRKKKVLAVLQVVDTIGLGGSGIASEKDPVMYHDDVEEEIEAFVNDSNITTDEQGYGANIKAKDGNDHDSSGEAYQLPELRNIGDALNLKDYVKVMKDNKDITNEVRPVYAAASTASAAYIELDTITGQLRNLSDTQHENTIFTAEITTSTAGTKDTVYFKVTSGTVAG